LPGVQESVCCGDTHAGAQAIVDQIQAFNSQLTVHYPNWFAQQIDKRDGDHITFSESLSTSRPLSPEVALSKILVTFGIAVAASAVTIGLASCTI